MSEIDGAKQHCELLIPKEGAKYVCRCVFGGGGGGGGGENMPLCHCYLIMYSTICCCSSALS